MSTSDTNDVTVITFEGNALDAIKAEGRSAAANGTCVIGGEPVFFAYASSAAGGPGHIYSDAGEKEYKMSGCCEYHFDNMFSESDDEDDNY